MTQLPPVIIRTGSYLAKVNPALVFPPSARAMSSVNVSGAGSTGVNGVYDYDGSKWVKGAYIIELPQGPNWVMRSGATMFYVADQTEAPWDAVWQVGVGGTAPVPTVTEVAP